MVGEGTRTVRKGVGADDEDVAAVVLGEAGWAGVSTKANESRVRVTASSHLYGLGSTPASQSLFHWSPPAVLPRGPPRVRHSTAVL